MLRPVVARADALRVPGVDPAVGRPLDAVAVLAHRDAMAAHWKDDDQVDWLASAGIDLVRGHGRLDGPRRVLVDTDDGQTVGLEARHAVAVCTGSAAALPDLPGLDTLRPWTSREATSAQDAPPELMVVGGGVVAVEMATAWQALGSRVTMLVRGNGLLPRMEPFAGRLVADGLREAGVDIRFEAAVASAVRDDGPAGRVRVTLAGGERLAADEILFATGRSPRTADIGLETVGLVPGDWLTVDDMCGVQAVSCDWLYAVGDVNHRALLTHQGKYQARVAGAAVAARAHGTPLEGGRWGAHAATADVDAVPQVVFTDPEVASVGLTTLEAERTGRRVKVVDYDIGRVAGAVQYATDYRGHARMLVDEDRGTVAGVTFAGPGVGELLHSATVVVTAEIPLERLWHAVPAFPTISEVWLRLLETYRG
jgi:dihydrolipoamide dehydrogenase